MAIKIYQDGMVGGDNQTYLQASSTTVTKDTLCTFASGYLTPATSSTAEVRVLALQTSVAGSGEHPAVLCKNVSEADILIADTTGNTSQALVGTKVDLTDAATVNQWATTTKVVRVVGVVGAAADKKVLIKVVSKDA